MSDREQRDQAWRELLRRLAPHAEASLVKVLAAMLAGELPFGVWAAVIEALQEAQFMARLDGRAEQALELGELVGAIEARDALAGRDRAQVRAL